MIKKYRKKPVVIEAVLYDGEESFHESVLPFLMAGRINCKHHAESGVVIPTLEGDMLAAPGDYIIKGIKGEFYPCKPDIFEATYEEVIDEECL
mgnify:CR=1 FL=1